MDRASLERFLQDGLSLEQIGRRVGRDSSTVGYWVRKHGLTAVHKDKYSARGGLDREQLEPLVEQGFSIARIARTLDRSEPTVQYWLRKHGLLTRAAKRRRDASAAKQAGQATAKLVCRHHGLTEYWLEGRGNYRCLRCRSEAVTRRRRKVRATLIAEAGGACTLCGYDRCGAALQFHHLDRSEKAFTLGEKGLTRSIEVMRQEAKKCVLLCANCHAEVEAGSAKLRESKAVPS